MKHKNLIFDLYGTLVDIHTEESGEVWNKTAMYFGFHGADYTGEQLRLAFSQEMKQREAAEGQSYECFPEIPFEQVFSQLFLLKGVDAGAKTLGFNAAQFFRICSIEYIKLYPGVKEALNQLRAAGFRLFLLSNAQRVFTEYELRLLGLWELFDGIYISSDHRCRKPDRRFFEALLNGEQLAPENCLMIGNDRDTDIAGARACGMSTLFMHTNLTPIGQKAAAEILKPEAAGGKAREFEFEGSDWTVLSQHIMSMG